MRRSLAPLALAGLLCTSPLAGANTLSTPHTADAAPAAAPLPLWELGLAGIAISVPDYPGADRNRLRVLPLPYGIYRGKTLRADDEGLRSRYRFSPTAELDVSFGGALPADSSGNAARDGMPDLDLLLEVGPQLTLKLHEPQRGELWRLVLPLRAVFSTDFTNLRHRGFLLAPELSYSRRKVAGSPYNLSFTVGAHVGDDTLARYFYDVAPAFALPERPAYAAKAGFIESTYTASVSRSLSPRLNVFGFTRLSSLAGSANRNSPLLRDTLNTSVGLGFTYQLRQSPQTVGSDD